MTDLNIILDARDLRRLRLLEKISGVTAAKETYPTDARQAASAA